MGLLDRIGDTPAAFGACFGAETFHPSAHEYMVDPEAMASRRVLEQVRRIARETGGREAVHKSTRGSARRVVCLTDVDPDTGRLRRFGKVSDAARWVGRACDNLCQAIRRKGECGEHRWAYEDGLPAGFNEDAILADLATAA